jgi:hypothetical protein
MAKTVPLAFTSHAGMDISRDNGLVVDHDYEDRARRAEAGGHSAASTASLPVRPAWMPRLIWSMTDDAPFETV